MWEKPRSQQHEGYVAHRLGQECPCLVNVARGGALLPHIYAEAHADERASQPREAHAVEREHVAEAAARGDAEEHNQAGRGGEQDDHGVALAEGAHEHGEQKLELERDARIERVDNDHGPGVDAHI